jgi:mono/diheme cytochrome c family protein
MRRVFGIGLAVLVAGLALPSLAMPQGNAEKGKAPFVQNCAPCHGQSGKGDGAAAAALNPKPRDLTDKAYMAGLKDEYLIDIVKKGGAAVGKSAVMPPWGAVLKDDQIRDVITFVRTLAK